MPAIVASFIAGATCCIFAAVSAVSKSLFSPRIHEQRLSGKRLEEWPKVDSRRRPERLERLRDGHVVVEPDFAILLAAVAPGHPQPILMGIMRKRTSLDFGDRNRPPRPSSRSGGPFRHR